MEDTRLDVDDVLVLLLGAPSEYPRLRDRVEGITRLEKMFFLLQHEGDLPIPMDGGFVPHNFGPFSARIYQAIDVLAAAELIEDSANLARDGDDTWERENLIYNNNDLYNGDELPDRFATRDFSLTERGRRYYKALLRELPPGVEARVSEFKTRFGRMPLRQLVRYVYEQPEYQMYLGRSIIKDEVLGT